MIKRLGRKNKKKRKSAVDFQTDSEDQNDRKHDIHRQFSPEELASLPGSLLRLSNTTLGIENRHSSAHPALVRALTRDNHALCSSGTGASGLPKWHADKYVLEIEPSGENGLRKTTFFQSQLKRISTKYLFRSCLIGRLSFEDWQKARQSLILDEKVSHGQI